MKRILQILALTAGCLAIQASGEQVKLDISWSLDPKTESYTNNQTKIEFPKAVAGFERTRATPAKKDGSASFAYQCESGVVTVYLTHRLIRGFQGHDDCTPEFRNSFLKVIHQENGEADEEVYFSFSFPRAKNLYPGLGSTIHFLKSPEIGQPVYSEFGAILVGDFLYYYRATFWSKAGLHDLASMLTAIGFEGRANQRPEPNAGTTSVSPSTPGPGVAHP